MTNEQAAEVDAAHKYVESVVESADAKQPYPMWHGWALREAFLAGIKNERESRLAADTASETKTIAAVAEWLNTDTPAELAFTAGLERQIADLIETDRAKRKAADAAREAEGALPISYEWLQDSHGFGIETLNGVSKLLSAIGDADPVEMWVCNEGQVDEWMVTLNQSNRNDHVLITSCVYTTRASLLALMAALKIGGK